MYLDMNTLGEKGPVSSCTTGVIICRADSLFLGGVGLEFTMLRGLGGSGGAVSPILLWSVAGGRA